MQRTDSLGKCAQTEGLLVDKIGPPLQHHSAMLQINRCVVVTADLVFICVSKLRLNPIRLELTAFIQNCGSTAAQVMPSLATMIPSSSLDVRERRETM